LETTKRRQQLVEVGLELFGARPYDEISMDDVAEAAGVSHGLVYHYFSDKRDLYLAALRFVGEQLLAATTADLDRPLLERLYQGMGAHLAFAEQYAPAYVALMSGGNGSDAEVRALCEEFRWRGLEEITRSLGIERPSPRLRIALRGWAGFQEGAVLEWLKERGLPRDQLLDLLAQALRDALASAGVDTQAES